MNRSLYSIALLGISLLLACDAEPVRSRPSKSTYVKPHVRRDGTLMPGHARQPVSTRKDAYKSRQRSRYYHATHPRRKGR